MVFGFWGNGIGGASPYPFFVNVDDDSNDNGKIAHDMYNVYVNEDYVGKKILVAQGEKVEDVDGFLKTQGFNDFNSSLNGNSYSINCKSDEGRHMKEALSVYLHNR